MSTTPAHVIVVGNEKGGSGKSTLAMHLIVGLLQSGYSVASIDVDFRQGSLSRYLANRRLMPIGTRLPFIAKSGCPPPIRAAVFRAASCPRRGFAGRPSCVPSTERRRADPNFRSIPECSRTGLSTPCPGG